MSDFDWVTARAKCSLGGVFEKLRGQVKEDVEIMEASKPEGRAFRFTSNGRKFTALVEGNNIHRSVIFALDLEHQRIAVYTDNDDLLYHAYVTLNREGKCVAKVEDEEQELWHLRKMALEKLFFTDY